jgi:hypothetical protein
MYEEIKKVRHAPLSDLISTVKAHGLEGLVAKRRDSSGAWLKMRVNRGQG